MCCWKTFYRHEDDTNVIMELKRRFEEADMDYTPEDVRKRKWARVMQPLWRFTDIPNSSKGAQVSKATPVFCVLYYKYSRRDTIMRLFVLTVKLFRIVCIVIECARIRFLSTGSRAAFQNISRHMNKSERCCLFTLGANARHVICILFD
jgi:hypothetical protein